MFPSDLVANKCMPMFGGSWLANKKKIGTCGFHCCIPDTLAHVVRQSFRDSESPIIPDRFFKYHTKIRNYIFVLKVVRSDRFYCIKIET